MDVYGTHDYNLFIVAIVPLHYYELRDDATFVVFRVSFNVLILHNAAITSFDSIQLEIEAVSWFKILQYRITFCRDTLYDRFRVDTCSTCLNYK